MDNSVEKHKTTRESFFFVRETETAIKYIGTGIKLVGNSQCIYIKITSIIIAFLN